ncbi:MAG TPA: hypothetical protein VFX15_07540 [Actinomycetes bacterium]|nr:hypothetical protein [Actinomycetes bacterium]
MAPLRDHLTLAVSPDGTQYITGNEVRSTVTGAIEERVPGVTIKQSVRWVQQGLTFLGKGDRPWVWLGVGRPVRLPVEPWGIQDDGWLFKVADKTCSTAYKLSTGGALTNQYQLCADTRAGVIDSASPSGKRGITRDLRIRSLPSGAEIATIDHPGPGWTAYPVKWESNDSIIVWTPGPDSKDKQTGTALLLRCLVSSGACERASPVIRDGWPYIAYLPFPGYGSPIF